MALPARQLTGSLTCLLLAAMLWVPPDAFGKELAGPPPELVGPPSPSSMVENVMNMMDKPRDFLSRKLVGFVSGVDRFFGNERHYEEANNSVFQLDVTRVMGYGGEHKIVVSARANVHLPNTEKKLHLVLETNPDRNAISDPKQVQPQTQTLNEPTTPDSIGAAVRLIREEAERWHIHADGGLKFQGLHSTPFLRARASFAVSLDQWRMKAAETAFWFNTLGVGETTQLDFERTISPSVLFRASSSATWLNDTQNFDLRQDFTGFHTLDDRTALLYQASIIGASQPTSHVLDYVLLMQYRYRLHRKWMYLDFSPQLHFPQERAYSLSPALSLRLEMLFDEMK
jgi:hypothetical protein